MSISVSLNWINGNGTTSGLSFSKDTLSEALAELQKSIGYYETECNYSQFQVSIKKHCEKCGGTGGKTIGKRVKRWVSCKHCKSGITDLIAEYTYKTPELLPSPQPSDMVMNGRHTYIHPNETPANFQAVYVRLPVKIQRRIEGGCDCKYCKDNPGKLPAWDTLAIPVTCGGNSHTWTVHWPELEREGRMLPSKFDKASA